MPPSSSSGTHPTAAAPMEHRRFGRTDERISVLTLGGMRFLQGWNPPRGHLPRASIDNAIDTTRRALDAGINHIETAHGYMKSEHLYGVALQELGTPRAAFKMMTKGAPMTADETRWMVDAQLTALQLDFVDFYGWHGINNADRLLAACRTGGPVETLLRLREEGLVRHVGFSTHAPLDILLQAIETDLFSFVNLHFYYFFQRNLPAVQRAGEKDMGVLIISPNDKGGQLWNPPPKLETLCHPLTPIQFNGRFCLSHREVTTLTLGMHAPEHFASNLPILHPAGHPDPAAQAARSRVDAALQALPTRCTYCNECLPCPEDILIPEVLRFRNLLTALDMKDFGRYRYNMLGGSQGHWFPGKFASRCTQCGDCLPRCPENLDIPRLLKETHRRLFDPKAWLKNQIEWLAGEVFRVLKKWFFPGP
ncbi:MAG: aldo/keto reductase [Nitrospinaceae bacterium]